MLLILQRYEFSSKSQLWTLVKFRWLVVADTTKVRIFKQITTNGLINPLTNKLLLILQRYEFSSKSQPPPLTLNISISCCWYYKGTNFQANHNSNYIGSFVTELLLILQRYEFSSKSQQQCRKKTLQNRCCWYYKGTNFQANHNMVLAKIYCLKVVADTTKVRIFKQITTQIHIKTT